MMSRIVSLRPVHRADKAGLYEQPRLPAKLHKSRPPPKYANAEDRRSGFLHFPRPTQTAIPKPKVITAPAPTSSRTASAGRSRPAPRRPALQRNEHHDVPWESLRQQGYVLRGSSTVQPALGNANSSSVTDAGVSSRQGYRPSHVYSPPTREQQHHSQRIRQTQPPAGYGDRDRPHREYRSREPSLSRSIASARSGRSIRSQLRPDNTFMYERPSKASYIAKEDARIAFEQERLVENERHLVAVMGRSRPTTPTSTPRLGRPSSRASSFSATSGIYAGSEGLLSQSVVMRGAPQWYTPAYPVQRRPIMVHSPAMMTSHTTTSLGRTVYPSQHHTCLRSATPTMRQSQLCTPTQGQHLQRCNTIASSCYSQQTMREIYPPALVPGSRPQSRAGSVSLTFSSSSGTSLSSPGESRYPPPQAQSLGTAQLLWQDLYNELLGEDAKVQYGPQHAPAQPQNYQRKADLRSQRGSIDVCPASPVAITPLRLRKLSCSIVGQDTRSTVRPMAQEEKLHEGITGATTAAIERESTSRANAIMQRARSRATQAVDTKKTVPTASKAPASILTTATIEMSEGETLDFTTLKSPPTNSLAAHLPLALATAHDAHSSSKPVQRPLPHRSTRIPAPRSAKFAGVLYKTRSA